MYSGKDNVLPSANEAQRLASSLRNCKVRYFKDNGHAILLVSEEFFPFWDLIMLLPFKEIKLTAFFQELLSLLYLW